jgi:hypothetical protein
MSRSAVGRVIEGASGSFRGAPLEKIKIRGLVRSSGWIFGIGGGVAVLKGLWDVFVGEPEANYYSPHKWDFVTQQQWLTWSGFEIAYGAACIGIACLLWKYTERLPECIERNS